MPKEQSFNGFGAPGAMYGAPETSSQQEDSYNAAYRHSSTQHQSGYANAPTETQVHKHIYVHVPPKDFEDEEMAPRVVHQVAPKQKHYKIVFIKAPSAPAIRAPVVPPTPQNEEKTLIYVLHKKPEAQPDIVIPSPAPTKPSKPEVYFIKYKTRKDEAPVYGPPPATYEIQARNDVEPDGEYGAPVSNDVNDFAPIDLNQYEPQITTAQPAVIDNAQPPQFITEEQAGDTYSAPTMSAFVGDEVQTTAAELSNQYLAPETTQAPIVVAEVEDQPRVPARSYGTPNRYFIKRRK